jgi:hypothetical protein
MIEPGIELKSGPTLILGTRKGVFYLQSGVKRRRWRQIGPSFLGNIVNHAVLDPRDGRTLLVAARTGHLGPTVFRSRDAGRTWHEARQPPAFDKAAPGEKARTVSHTFWLTPGHAAETDTWWAGTSPQALWRSDDAGETWQSVRGFNDHPDYEARTEDPQGGTPDGPVLHSILIDPRDAAHMYFGLSGGGVWETRDRGATWAPLNRGMASPLDDPAISGGAFEWQEIGPHFDPHCIGLHPLAPDVLYQQNHCGIYRLQRPADTWERIGNHMPREVGDIGFPIGLHPRDPDTCWVFPMDGTLVWPRTSPDGRPAVYRTRNAGRSWTRHEDGLPARAWYTVKRQCMSVDQGDPVGVYFGTTCGEIWSSVDEGESWRCIAQHLPEVYSVEAVELA